MNEAYQLADRSVAEFSQATKLKCPGGCGRCCESPFIEATPLECLPLAQTLLPKATEWIERLELHLRLDRTLPSSCPFYVSFGFGKGFCSVYEERPLICRLYGFAAYLDQKSEVVLDSCHYHTEHATELPSPDPDGTGRNTAPLYRDFKRRIKRTYPDLSQPTGVAQAVYQALLFLLRESKRASNAG